jgi:Fe-S-cluster containining protein
MSHPCLSCGACCAHFRVSLHWSEAEPEVGAPDLGGRVPIALTETFGPHQRSMRGTWAKRPHCIALEGVVGEGVRCTIYDARPNACRDLRMSWEDGTPNPQCDQARAAYGLAPLTKDDIERAQGT